MNTIDLFYQIFRARYSLDDINRTFSEKYRLGFAGSEEDRERMLSWLGTKTLSSNEVKKGVLLADIPQTDEDAAILADADIVVIHLGTSVWKGSDFNKLCERLPERTRFLFITEALESEPVDKSDLVEERVAARVHTLRIGHERESFGSLLLSAFGKYALRLGRDYESLRERCVSELINSTCNRLALVAAASSVTVGVPVVGQMIGLLAVSAETLVITAGQIKLCLLIGALYGRNLNFFDRVEELWPVVGCSWGWRTAARQLVGLMPVIGSVSKAAVAWSGTYFVGKAASRFYELGEHLSPAAKKKLMKQAKELAKDKMAGLLDGQDADDEELFPGESDLASSANEPAAAPASGEAEAPEPDGSADPEGVPEPEGEQAVEEIVEPEGAPEPKGEQVVEEIGKPEGVNKI